MDNRNHTPDKEPILKQVFHSYAEQTISNEQVRRILEPVLRMIEAGRFNLRRKYVFLPQALLTAMVIIVMSVVAVFANDTTVRGAPFVNPTTETISSSAAFAGNLSNCYCCEELADTRCGQCYKIGGCRENLNIPAKEDGVVCALCCIAGKANLPYEERAKIELRCEQGERRAECRRRAEATDL